MADVTPPLAMSRAVSRSGIQAQGELATHPGLFLGARAEIGTSCSPALARNVLRAGECREGRPIRAQLLPRSVEVERRHRSRWCGK
jgi:hypothetical protein